jgi:hypothetical protein
MAGLYATQLQGAELLDGPAAMLAFEGGQDALGITGLPSHDQVVLLGAANLEGFHRREGVSERVGGPAAQQLLDLAAEIGWNRGGAAGDQGVEDAALSSTAAVLEDDFGNGVVLGDWGRQSGEERDDDFLLKDAV